MQTVNFNDAIYQTEGSVAQDGAVLITALPGPELVTLHNLINSNMGINKRVKKFADKKTAVKRVAAKLIEYDQYDETDEGHDRIMKVNKKKMAKKTLKRKVDEEPKKPRKLRGMHFVFRPNETIRSCKGSIKSNSDDTRTLRQRAVDLLTTTGATFGGVSDMVVKFDQDRGKPTSDDTLERRTYELIRLCHYYLGYGLKMNDDVITAYSDPKDAPKS